MFTLKVSRLITLPIIALLLGALFICPSPAQVVAKKEYPALGPVFQKTSSDWSAVYQYRDWRKASADELVKIIKENIDNDGSEPGEPHKPTGTRRTELAIAMLGREPNGDILN